MIAILQANIEKLLEQYDFLKEENEILNHQNFSLQQVNKTLQDEVSSYKNELATLKIAKTIEGSEKYKSNTQEKIDFLISEIDRCIKDLST